MSFLQKKKFFFSYRVILFSLNLLQMQFSSWQKVMFVLDEGLFDTQRAITYNFHRHVGVLCHFLISFLCLGHRINSHKKRRDVQKGKWPQQGRKGLTRAQPGHSHLSTSGILFGLAMCQSGSNHLRRGKNDLKRIRHMKTAILSKEIQKVFERFVQQFTLWLRSVVHTCNV